MGEAETGMTAVAEGSAVAEVSAGAEAEVGIGMEAAVEEVGTGPTNKHDLDQ